MVGLNPDRNLVPDVVMDDAATVRPWNPPWKTMTFGRPVDMRARRSAASTASDPELAKNIRSSLAGSTSPIRSTSVSSGRCSTVVYWAWMSVATWRWAASTTFGWQCPVLVTPMPAVKSR